MQQVIIWSVVGGLCVFTLGMISAIGSHRRRETVPGVSAVTHKPIKTAKERNTNENSGLATAVAGGGHGNVADSKAVNIAGGEEINR